MQCWFQNRRSHRRDPPSVSRHWLTSDVYKVVLTQEQKGLTFVLGSNKSQSQRLQNQIFCTSTNSESEWKWNYSQVTLRAVGAPTAKNIDMEMKWREAETLGTGQIISFLLFPVFFLPSLCFSNISANRRETGWRRPNLTVVRLLFKV